MKVIKFSEKNYQKNYQSIRRISQFSQAINGSWFNINEKVLPPLAKIVLILLGVTASASATDATIQNRFFGSGTAALISFK